MLNRVERIKFELLPLLIEFNLIMSIAPVNNFKIQMKRIFYACSTAIDTKHTFHKNNIDLNISFLTIFDQLSSYLKF